MPNLHLVLPLHFRQALHRCLGGLGQSRHVDTRALQQRLRAIGLTQHGQQQVSGLNVSVVSAERQCLGFAQGFLELGGEFVESHGSALRMFVLAGMWRLTTTFQDKHEA